MIHLLCSKASREAILKKHPALIHEQEPPSGRGFTSLYIQDNQIDQAWRHPEVNRLLPWRYREKPTRIKLYPTPANESVNLLQESLSISTYQAIQEKVTRQFGGRCQVCGEAPVNTRGRRVSPRLYGTWLHTAHPNPRRQIGMRELLGVASVCNSCLDVLTVADARPCSGHPTKRDRKVAWQRALQSLAIHNHWSGKKTRDEVTRTIRQRKALDSVEWVHDVKWLVDQKLIRPTDLALSHAYIKKGYLLSERRYVVPPALSETQSTGGDPGTQRKAS